LNIDYSREELLEVVRACIIRNDYDKNTYIQPRIWPFETLLGKDTPLFANERRFMVSSWRRISSDALPPQAKSWANYANSMLAIREARRCGYNNAVFLDKRGFVSESTLACLMMVRDGKAITTPVAASILESVTRGCFIEFIPDLGFPVEVRDVTRVELYASDEAFLCGTGGECTPITSIDDLKLGKEYPGPITKQIAEYYSEILAGNVEKYKHWLTPV
jgi:branched-chain amino acid aminotransferase